MATLFQADQIAAMGAAVDHRVDFAVLAADDDDRGLAEKGRPVIAGLGQLVGQREVLPARPEKDAVELGMVDFRVGKHPVGDPRITLFRPFERLLHANLRDAATMTARASTGPPSAAQYHENADNR